MDNVLQEGAHIAAVETSLVPKDSIIRSLMADDEPLHETLVTYNRAAEVIRALADQDAVLDEIIRFDGYGRLKDDSIAALRQLINRLDNPQEVGEVPSTFCGIAGYQVVTFFRAFFGRFLGECNELRVINGEVEPVRPEYRIKTSGKITDYLFIAGMPDPTMPGRWIKNNGHLSVNVVDQEFYTNDELIACTPTRTKLYHWDIELKDCEVHKRDDTTFLHPDEEKRKRPFSKINLPFPPHSVDPDDGRSIWCRCLDHKIYAKGKQVIVHNVFCRVNDGSLTRLDDDHCGYERTETEESCVDLMFKGFPPSTQLPPQIEYCLGRCVEPRIVNTGGG